MMELDTIVCMDALAYTDELPDESVNAVITDLPYGQIAANWDEIIPFAPMWAAVKRVLKPRGVFVTTASQPFTSKLVMSNLDWFRYEWIWDKVRPSGFQYARFRPMMQHENILLFSRVFTDYNPQKVKREKPVSYRNYRYSQTAEISADVRQRVSTEISPKTILSFVEPRANASHPTQKPVALYEYLIRTYTQPGDVVLDFCCGSGTTGRAAQLTGRHYLLCDSDPAYVEIARARLAMPYTPDMFTVDALTAPPTPEQTTLF